MNHRIRSLLALACAAAAFAAAPQEEPASRPAAEPEAPAEAAPAFDRAQSDPEAIRLVEGMWKAMGGREKFDRIDFLKFTFSIERGGKVVSSRTHLWDRRANRAHLAMVTNRGDIAVALDLATRKGFARENGQPIPEEDRKGVAEYAYGLWVNDFYWLLAPWKLLDPGVHVRMAEDVVVDGRTLKQVAATFDPGIGLTSGDRYWFAIDPTTGKLAQWSFHLQGWAEDKPADTFVWEGWEDHAGVQFSTIKRKPGGDVRLLNQGIELPPVVEADLFEGLEGE